jgi:cytochrome b pre-mRNA-processing protein 3
VGAEGYQVSFLSRIFSGKREREAYRPLYGAIVNAGRDPAWYVEGQVPDTIDGRFDMIAALLTLVLLRLEAEGDVARTPSVLLTELFIDDMDGSIRQLGIGDIVVGKHIGKMMGALGGRLTTFRSEMAEGGDFTGPATRNIFHDAPPSQAGLNFVSSRLKHFSEKLREMPGQVILKGELPQL